MLAPEVAGRVVGIKFEAGSRVGAGALLVQLYDTPERADRRAEKARADFAGVQLARSQELADRQSVGLGKSVSVRVDHGGCSLIKKKKTTSNKKHKQKNQHQQKI